MCRLCIGNYSEDPSLDEQLTDLHEILEAVIRAALADEALASIIREGHRTGEGRGEFPGEVHYKALRAAETDATKRALATFRRPLGLELYGGSVKKRQAAEPVRRTPAQSAAQVHSPAARPTAVAPPPHSLAAA